MKSEDSLVGKIVKLYGFDYDSLHETFSKVKNGKRVWYDIPSDKECLELLKENKRKI